MYSPKIDEEHIPKLFRIAAGKGMPMTKVVNEAVERYIKREEKKVVAKTDRVRWSV